MNHLSLTQLVQNGDAEGVKLLLQTHTYMHNDISRAMMQCIKYKQRDILGALMDYARTHLKPSSDLFSGPLAWAASDGEDAALFEYILKDTPSKYSALSSALTHLMQQEKEGVDQYVMTKFQLWCDKADAQSLQKALENIVVWNLPRFVYHLYPKWVAGAPEDQMSAALFENLVHCFNWGEGQHGASVRHPEIYDFLLAQVAPSMAQRFLDIIAKEQRSAHFSYMPGKPQIYEILEPVLQSFVQNDVLHKATNNCAGTTPLARKI